MDAIDELRAYIIKELDAQSRTRVYLAEKAGVAASTVTRFLNGHSKPDDETLRKLARVMGAPKRLVNAIMSVEAAPDDAELERTLMEVERAWPDQTRRRFIVDMVSQSASPQFVTRVRDALALLDARR